ncbi:MAG: hypothetical protein HC908_01605 [Calothrix sp. SM1_7_51]|nr:hypothetical protein [Calothrix sp. SM1_7_51]
MGREPKTSPFATSISVKRWFNLFWRFANVETVQTKEKILAAITAILLLIGFNSSDKRLNIGFKILGIGSGISLLCLAPKPWLLNQKQQEIIEGKDAEISQLTQQIKLEKQSENLQLSIDNLNNLIDSKEARIKALDKLLYNNQDSLNLRHLQLEQEIESLKSEASKLRETAQIEADKLALEIKNNAEAEAAKIIADARINLQASVYGPEQQAHQQAVENLKAEKLALSEKLKALNLDIETLKNEARTIKLHAEADAEEIKASARNSLQETVYGPEQQAHSYALQQIQEQKEATLSELERLQRLAEKVEAAIEKMKDDANLKNQKYREKLKKEANQQVQKELEIMQGVLEDLENQLKLVTSENQFLKQELEELDKPDYPEGWSEHETYARAIIGFYEKIYIKLDYKMSMRENNRVLVRVIPRETKVGEQQLRTYVDRLKRAMDLSEYPTITTTAGCIQFELRLVQLERPIVETYEPVLLRTAAPAPQLPDIVHPEVSPESTRKILDKLQLQSFEPPRERYSPMEPLTETERLWVLWLWRVCNIRDQNTIMSIVWKNTRGRGVVPGASQSYNRARDKIHQILDEAAIQRRRNNYE